MIDLNCSYEESKKILDLGYDFTFICRDFELREEKEITKFVLVEKHDDGLVSLWDCGERKTCVYSTKSWWIIPIIPKAALEKCLPDLEEEKSIINARVWLGKDLYVIQEDYIYSLDSDGSGYGSYDLERLKEQGFNSAFEAFTWCHENYPKELKKKFEEVMG